MSDYFITNITGVPTTGSYGTDGKPLNVNNDGGIEVTPQDAGNVPSAGTESREGVDNDKSISANTYNQSASSTDSQAIGPSSPPDQTNYSHAQDNSLYKQAQIGGDKAKWNLYKEEPTSGAILSGDLSTYDGLYSPLSDMAIEEGQSAALAGPSIKTSITVNLGGSTSTSVFTTAGGSTQTNNGRPISAECSAETVDKDCEIGTCNDYYLTPIGKKMRIFQGNGCQGLNGYWMQITNPVSSNRNGTNPRYVPPKKFNQTGCETFTGDRDRKALVRTRPAGTNLNCWLDYCAETNNGDGIGSYFRPVWGHLLTYVGTGLSEIGDKKWCEYCNQAALENDAASSPSRKKCSEVAGWQGYFLGGPSCDDQGNPTTVNDNKLYGCCCPHVPGTPAGTRTSGCAGASQTLITLTQVGTSVIMGSADDPCDCLYRENYGPIFQDNFDNITGNGKQQVFVSGCTEASAQKQAANTGLANNIYVMSTGTGQAPYFDSGECAWMYDFKGAVRCVELDALDSPNSGYCSAGFNTKISDRYLFEDANRFTSYTGCDGASCSVECASGDASNAPLFAVGEQIRLRTNTTTAYENVGGSWANPSAMNVELTGANSQPMSATCSGVATTCFWTFSADNQSGANTGEWTLTNANDCCDCVNVATGTGVGQLNTAYSGMNGEGTGLDCPAGSGCSYWHCWRVTDRAFGGYNSSPDSIDCTWGYVVEFTGNFGDACDVTGTFPDSRPPLTARYLQESYLQSGTCS